MLYCKSTERKWLVLIEFVFLEETIMKKITRCVLIITMLCLCLSACDRDYSTEKRSPKDFSQNASELGVTRALIPEEFVEKFTYTDGYYCHYCFSKSFFSSSSSDRALMFLQYDGETYEEAKAYVFANMDLSEESVESYNGYVFFDIYTESFGINAPYQFKRFAYNESKKTLIFMGHYSFRYDDILDEYSDNWGAFLNDFYGDWYDFSS